jgi:hypothetical protein
MEMPAIAHQVGLDGLPLLAHTHSHIV